MKNLHNISGLLNAVWNRVTDFGERKLRFTYPSDFFVWDRGQIEELEPGESLTIRFYNDGTHVIAHSKIDRSEYVRYFVEDPSAFGGEENARFIAITRTKEADTGQPDCYWSFLDVTDNWKDQIRLQRRGAA